jgi:tetrahydromethanopterin S-methyltransferase subunit G
MSDKKKRTGRRNTLPNSKSDTDIGDTNSDTKLSDAAVSIPIKRKDTPIPPKRKVSEVTSPESPKYKLRPIPSRRKDSDSNTELRLQHRRVSQCIVEDRNKEDRSIAQLILDQTSPGDESLWGYSDEEIALSQEKTTQRLSKIENKLDLLNQAQSEESVDNISIHSTDHSDEEEYNSILDSPTTTKQYTEKTNLSSSGEETLRYIDQAYQAHILTPIMASTPTPGGNKPKTPRSKLSDEIAEYMNGDEYNDKLKQMINKSIKDLFGETIEPMIGTRLDKIENDITSNNKVLSNLVEKIDKLDITRVDNKIKDFEKKITKADIKSVNDKLDEFEEKVTEINPVANSELVNTVDFIEQQLRANHLIISGIPERKDEDLERIVIALGKKLGVKILSSDINAAYRSGQSLNGRPKIITIKFQNQKVRRKLYRGRIKLRLEEKEDEEDMQTDQKPEGEAEGAVGGAESRAGTSKEEDGNKKKTFQVFINEDLTPKRAKIYKAVREIAIPRKWQTWTENGIIFLRTRVGTAAKKILTDSDLKDLKKQLE